MKEAWNKAAINDVALVGDGAHASIKRVDKGVLYLTSKNFDLNGLKLSKVDYISLEDYLKYFKEDSKALTKPKKGDILLSIIGSMGAAYLVNDDDNFGLSSSVSILRPNTNIVPLFLYYWIKGQYFQESIKGIKSGVAQSFLSLAMIRSLPCIIPPLATQQKIADILSAYDDLIENNEKRIELLEEQAQLIYEEWFMRMKFPNHEDTSIDKETGLPEGWSKKYLTDVLNFKTGKLDSNAHVEDGAYDFYTCAKEVYKTSTYCFEGEAVLLGGNNATGNFALFYVNDKFDAYQRTYIVTSQDESLALSYVFFCIENLLPYFQNVSSGASTKFLTMKIFDKTKIVIPDPKVLKKYGDLAKPCFDSIIVYKKKNQLLKEARDILLPRLMMGMIEV